MRYTVSSNVMKWFLDLGTHYLAEDHPGNSGKAKSGLLSFLESGHFRNQEWNVWTFEASPRIFAANNVMLPSISQLFHSFEAFHYAICGHNGEIGFLDLVSNPAGSNCVNKTFLDVDSSAPLFRGNDQKVTVPAISLVSVLEEVIGRDSDACIEIKCDIEGAEFAALPNLLRRKDLLRAVDAVYIEWHQRFWRKRRERLVKHSFKIFFVLYCRMLRVRVASHW